MSKNNNWKSILLNKSSLFNISLVLILYTLVSGCGMQSTTITATPISGNAPLTVQFSCSILFIGGTESCSSPSQRIGSWNFGDGTTGTGLTATHTYSSAGTYTATVVVTDYDGETVTATQTITVTAPPPPAVTTPPPTPDIQATLTATPTSGNAPLNVAFSSTSSGGSGTFTQNWNFGDGSTGSGASVSHTYSTPGTFTATMTVTSGSKTAVKTQTITATPSQTPDTNETVCNERTGKGSGKTVFLANAPVGKRCCGANGKQDSGFITSDKLNACIFNNRTCGTRTGLCWKEAISENFGDVELIKIPTVNPNIRSSKIQAFTLPTGLWKGVSFENIGFISIFSGTPTDVEGLSPVNSCPANNQQINWAQVAWGAGTGETTADSIYSCVSKTDIISDKLPKGMWCGYTFVNQGTRSSIYGSNVLCEGSNPAVNCPAGYKQFAWSMISWQDDSIADSLYTCILQEDKFASELPQGAWCGFAFKNDGTRPSVMSRGSVPAQFTIKCQGSDPDISCPLGYQQEDFYMVAWHDDSIADYVKTCVKK